MSVKTVAPEAVQSWALSSTVLGADTQEPQVVSLVQEWAGAGSAFLYFFALTQITNLAAAEAAFSVAKAREKKERAYARLNDQNTCLYVGSSREVAKRFKEHLGYGQPKTYSLQLAHWAQPLSLQLEFVCARYSPSAQGEVLQALEDTLWASTKPMFGRRGAK